MNPSLVEKTYPIEFREKEAKILGANIKNRRSVVLTGMKRVGISNFLRFFLFHDEISKKYLDDKKYFIIPVDLNDLVEREIYPFWVLTFKRLADGVEKSEMPDEIKKQIDLYFSASIQSQDLFLTIDYLRKSLVYLSDNNFLPTIFFIRFDRMKDAFTPDLFANIQGLIDATHHTLSYVFTSARSLDHLEPEIFSKQDMLAFSDNVYVKPGKGSDTKIIFNSYLKKYDLKLDPNLVGELLKLVDGHTQYLLYALISIKESQEKIKPENLFEFLKNDERISLMSEELWESLTEKEQEILLKVVNHEKISDKDLKQNDYLVNTGFFDAKTMKMFSPIFEYFVITKNEERKRAKNALDFSKKEFALLKYLEENKDEICERDEIIENVWPEAENIGVTDWAIDRLVARVRTKLKDQNKNYEIVTIKTRGYKLVTK